MGGLQGKPLSPFAAADEADNVIAVTLLNHFHHAGLSWPNPA
jgi:hypothetical protein